MSVSFPAAFFFGLLSFFSPCVLPLVPAYLSYMSGASIEELSSARGRVAIKRTGLKSVLFVLGFSTVFIALGATATSVGQMLNDKLDLFMKIGGVVLVVFGLHMAGLFKIKALYSEKRFHMRMGQVSGLGAFLIGVTFAFGWTPCIGPTLAAILALAADGQTVMRGVGLLAVYSLGLGIPFLAAGFATGTVLKALVRFRRHFRTVEIVSGAMIVVVGVLIFTGKMQLITAMMNVWALKG